MKKQYTSDLEYRDNKGRKWSAYAIDFESPDGDYTTTLYAISHEHAELQLQALKETGKVMGEIAEILPKREDDED